MIRFFTFGAGQPNFPGYAIVHGTDAADCRGRMRAFFGSALAMEYQSEDEIHPSDRILRVTLWGNGS